MFLRWFNSRMKRVTAYISGLILIAVSFCSDIMLYVNGIKYNENMFESTYRMGMVAFDRINDLMRAAEEVVTSNRDFFVSDNNGNEGILKVASDINKIKMNCPYVERIVFYRTDDDLLITNMGTVPKKEFFEREYNNDNAGIKYWDGIMKNYSSPTIVPTMEYGTKNGGTKEINRLFVIPKIYMLHNVGVLFFVNEDKFFSYCGFNSGMEISFYDREGRLVIGDGKTQISIDANTYARMNILGRYEKIKTFDYEDMYIAVVSENIQIFISFLISALAVLALIAIMLYISRQKKANMGMITNDGMGVQAVLYAAMSDRKLYELNKGRLNSLLLSNNNSAFAVCAVIFKNITEGRITSLIKNAESKISGNAIEVFKAGNSIIYLVNIPERMNSQKSAFIRKCFEGFISVLGENVETDIIYSETFTDLERMPEAYTEIKNKLLLYGKADAEILQFPEISANYKALEIKHLANGEYDLFLKNMRNEIENAENCDMPYNLFLFYLIHLYFTTAEILTEKNIFLEDTYEVLLKGIRANELSFDKTKMSNLIINLFIDVEKYSSAKSDKSTLLTDVLNYIAETYKKDMSQTEIAEKFNMNQKNFSAFFKRNVGMSYLDYITGLRITEAKKLLVETDKSVREIYESIGYISGSTFSMMFKKQVGESPVKYRKNNQG